MEFGYFEEFPRREGRSVTEDFAEGLALAEAAEQLGMDAVWLAELHCAPERSVLASPLTVASAIVARTTRLRVGTAVQVLPLGDPFRTAEEAATVDQISHGRLIFGVGRSSSPRFYTALGIPYSESRDRFTEALEVLVRSWTEDSFSHHGRYYDYENVCLVPKPYQQPHPPIRVAINSADSFVSMGELGLPILAAVRQGSFAELGPNVAAYRAAWRSSGHVGDAPVYLRVPIYIADSRQEAEEEPRESLFRLHSVLDRLPGHASASSLTYEEILRDKAIVGTADDVTERLRQLDDEYSLSGVLAELNCGGLISPDHVLRSMREMCERVMPHFRG